MTNELEHNKYNKNCIINNEHINDTIHQSCFGISGSELRYICPKCISCFYDKYTDLISSENNNNINTMYFMAFYHKYITKNYDEMKKILISSIEKGCHNSMHLFGEYYQHIEHNNELAKKYYNMAIDQNNSNAMYCIAGMYFDEYRIMKKYDKKLLSKKYYKMSALNGNTFAMYQYATYFFDPPHVDKSLMDDDDIYFSEIWMKYIMMAIKGGNTMAMCELGDYYRSIKNYDLMKKYYLMAIDNYGTTAIGRLLNYMSPLGIYASTKHKNFVLNYFHDMNNVDITNIEKLSSVNSQ